MKVEGAILGSPSLINFMVSEDIKRNLWLFEVDKCYDSQVEKKNEKKMSLKDLVSCIFSLTTWGLESGKLPELFHGNKLDNGIQHAAKSASSFLFIERWLPNTKQKKDMLGFCSGKKASYWAK